jgi:Ulp1 protease family, C-terminal catalytic domain
LKASIPISGIRLAFDNQSRKASSHQRTLLDNKTYEFCFPQLTCEECCVYKNGIPISVGNEQYYKDRVNHTGWFEQDLVTSYAVLASHVTHDPSLCVFNITTPGQKLFAGQRRDLPMGVNRLVSVFHGKLHYSVAILDIKRRTTLIYDGLLYSLDTWKQHVLELLARFKLVPLDIKETFQIVPGRNSMLLKDRTGNWTLKNGVPMIQQTNEYDCGPLACLMIMKIFGRLPNKKNYKSFGSYELRSCVIDDFRELVQESKKDLYFSVRRKKHKGSKISNVMDDSICSFCHDDISATDNFQMPCCKEKYVHVLCHRHFAASSSICLFCSKDFGIIPSCHSDLEKTSSGGSSPRDRQLLFAMMQETSPTKENTSPPIKAKGQSLRKRKRAGRRKDTEVEVMEV